MRKSVFILACLMHLIIYSVHDVKASVSSDSLSQKISALKEAYNVRSLIGGVWEKGNEIIRIALGESMTRVPATVEMHFRVGGVSETFMGTLVMLLVEEGKLSLDDKLSKWFPEFYESENVTVGMLINNIAGYKDYVYNTDFQELVRIHPFRYITHQEIYEYANAYAENEFTPGTKQKYSHTEFTILADVIEKATGKSMKELYEEKIFQPMKLVNTGYSSTAELPNPVLHSFSDDRGVYEDATYFSPSWAAESGPLYSTIGDLGKWAQIFGTGRLLKPESFNRLIKMPVAVMSDRVYFASGFAVANGWYFQNPSFNGYSGGFGFYPPRNLSIIIYTTKSEENKEGGQAFEIFLELVNFLVPEANLDFLKSMK